jgi:enoyl-CoA hydratase/carnithine racemase
MKVNEKDGVITLSFDQPEKQNPFTANAATQIEEIADSATRDEHSAIVLTGTGSTFCAGGDLESLSHSGESAQERYERYAPGTDFVSSLLSSPVPTIAKINGDAVGAGLSIVALCDFAYASEEAEFSAAFVNVGLIPDSGLTVFLPRIVGLRTTLDLMLTGRKISASEALEMDLINDVVSSDELDQSVQSQIDKLSDLPTGALSTIRRTVHENAARHYEEGIDYENLLQSVMAGTEDHQQAVEELLDNT